MLDESSVPDSAVGNFRRAMPSTCSSSVIPTQTTSATAHGSCATHDSGGGEPRTTVSWRYLVDALADEVKEGGSVLNLQSVPLVPGATVPLGEAVVTLVAGWPRWDGPGPTLSERLNAISIVVRLE